MAAFTATIAIVILILITVQVLHKGLLLFAAIVADSPKPSQIKDERLNRFIVIIPAHDESLVIGCLLDSIRLCDYPAELVRIFVVADNCSDKTAAISAAHGATALERFDESKNGKPFAIGWALEQPEVKDCDYDVLIIFDADNLVDRNFFIAANHAVNRGAQAFQCLVETKNGLDSWVAASNYINFCVLNRIMQAGRSSLGLGVQLFGTGMGFVKGLFEAMGRDAVSLTEDKELTYRLLLNGIKVTWLKDAVVYDEKPTKARQAFDQQSRWISGYLSNFATYVPLLARSLGQRLDWAVIDTIYHLTQPLLPAKNLILLPLLIIVHRTPFWLWWAGLFLAVNCIRAVALVRNGANPIYYGYLVLLYPYRVLSLAATLKSLLLGTDRTWRHTSHTKGLGIEKMSQ